ncbi:MAG: ComF family protein [Dehalococcoidia bacterium]|nr:ComF family protein [Dehalococcoidia bacterium]
MATVLARALDLLYPPRCVACAAFGKNLCESCAGQLLPASGPGRCGRCGVRRDDEGRCPDCSGWRDLDGARAAFEMTGAARRVVHGLKFSGIRDLADDMAEALVPVVSGLAPDAIFPIPLHPSRHRRRGFNQAGVLFERLGWPPPPGRLERVRATASQVGLSASERRENVAGAFRYRGPSLKGATVAVLDDVVTTGATAGECARVLREHGAARVYALAYARAPYHSPASGRSDG